MVQSRIVDLLRTHRLQHPVWKVLPLKVMPLTCSATRSLPADMTLVSNNRKEQHADFKKALACCQSKPDLPIVTVDAKEAWELTTGR